MNRKTMALSLTHLAALGVGLWFAHQASNHGDVKESQISTTAGTTTRQFSTNASRKSESQSLRALGTWRGSEFQRAWNAIRTARLTTRERMEAQTALLRKWAEVDLSAAIEAALEEAWDDDLREGSWSDPPLLQVFGDIFAADPVSSWDMIHGGRYGIAAAMLRSVWLDHVFNVHPELVAEKIGSLSWRERRSVLPRMTYALDNEQSKKVIAILSEYSSELVPDEVLSRLLASREGMLFDSVEELLAAGANINPRLKAAQAYHLGAVLQTVSPEQLREQLDQLPDELKASSLSGAMSAVNLSKSEQLIGVLDLMVQEQSWSAMAEYNLPNRLKASAEHGDAEMIANWVTALPQRKEFNEYIHRGVEKYLRENMEESREWIASIDDPVWRDRAYSEYSQQALHAKNDPEASRWALDQIQDPAFKQEAESWRNSWEKR